MTALLSAAAGGHVECVKLLIDDKCDINTTNPVGSFNILSNMLRVQKNIHFCLLCNRFAW